jgi:hypothetical protein
MVFVVIVVTCGVGTVEGAIQGGIAFVVIQQLLTYAPPRFQGVGFILFALGALTYAAHPEGVVEFVKRRQTLALQARFFKRPTSGGDGTTARPLTLPEDLAVVAIEDPGKATVTGGERD